MVGVTAFASKVHDLSAKDTVTIETHADGIWIDLSGGDADE